MKLAPILLSFTSLMKYQLKCFVSFYLLTLPLNSQAMFHCPQDNACGAEDCREIGLTYLKQNRYLGYNNYQKKYALTEDSDVQTIGCRANLSLEHFDVSHCPQLKKIILKDLPNLKKLMICNCQNIVDLFAGSSFEGLEEIDLHGCTNLTWKSFHALLSACSKNLRLLKIEGCNQLLTTFFVTKGKYNKLLNRFPNLTIH